MHAWPQEGVWHLKRADTLCLTVVFLLHQTAGSFKRTYTVRACCICAQERALTMWANACTLIYWQQPQALM